MNFSDKRVRTITIVLIIAISIISLYVIQNFSNLANEPSTSSTPKPSSISLPTTSPTMSTTIPSPTGTQPSLTPETSGTSSTPIVLQPGEVIDYQGQYLSSIVTLKDNAIVGPQFINPMNYRLKVTGLVNNPYEYEYSNILSNFTKYQKVVTLNCVEGWSVTILWEGILLSDLLNQTGAIPSATVVIFYASDGYTTALPVDYLMQNKILLAYKMNNVTLPPSKGWPFMLVAESQYGYKWIKWITQIEVSDNSDYLGYWEQRGYPNDASIQR